MAYIFSSTPPAETVTPPKKSPLYPSLKEAPTTPPSPYISYPYQTTPQSASKQPTPQKQATPQQTPQKTPQKNSFQTPQQQTPKNAFQTPQKTPQQLTPQHTPQSTFLDKLQSPATTTTTTTTTSTPTTPNGGPKAATNLPNKGIMTEGETTMQIPSAELFVYDEASQCFVLKERSVEVVLNYTGDEDVMACICWVACFLNLVCTFIYLLLFLKIIRQALCVGKQGSGDRSECGQ